MPLSLKDRAKALKQRLEAILQHAQYLQDFVTAPVSQAIKARSEEDLHRAQQDMQQLLQIRHHELAKVNTIFTLTSHIRRFSNQSKVPL